MFSRMFERLRARSFDRAMAKAAAEAYQRTLAGDDGDLVLDDLAKRFGILEASTGTEDAWRREGARAVIVFLAGARSRGVDAINQVEMDNE